jgi:uncharacterized membrane protein YvbJ
MQCPKCGFTSFDHNTMCPKCGKDVSSTRELLNLLPVAPQDHGLSPVPFGRRR